MPCYSPLRAVLVSGPGGRRLSFSRTVVGKGLSLPCGRCIGCRLERSRQWAVRIMHEAKMHDENSFLTLTYDPENLPKDGSISVEHCQLFLKRLRARLAPKRVRFFLCGEYGEKLGRPHYHAVLFGYFPGDAVRLGSVGEFTLFDSPDLEEIWGKGQVRVGAVSFESASYVANYATKKIIGRKEVVDAHYQGRKPEFLLMSRRPGIGRGWYDVFKTDVYPSDEVIVRGRESRPPRYYDNLFKADCPDGFEVIRLRREAEAERLESFVMPSGLQIEVSPSNNPYRLAVREKVATAKLSLKSRSLEK